MFNAIVTVGIGAALGAWLRWGLGVLLNPVFPTIPLGTLCANLVGGYFMGVTMVLLTRVAGLPPEVRLFAATGFLGGLTTFSTFSAEAVTLIGRQQFGWTALMMSAHVIGSLLMTALGIISMNLLFAP
jgi:fluoride exporter